MSSLFGSSKPRPDPAQQRAQREQSQQIDKNAQKEAQELGSRRRLLRARRSGGSASLFAQTGAAGVKETLG